jgi:anti-anti-sigma factor
MHQACEVAMTPLALTHQHLPGATLVALIGELDFTNHEQLDAYLAQVCRRPTDCIVLDLAEVVFMDSQGLNVILRTRQARRAQGGDLWLAAPHPITARLLKITGADFHLVSYPTVDEALAAALTGAPVQF